MQKSLGKRNSIGNTSIADKITKHCLLLVEIFDGM